MSGRLRRLPDVLAVADLLVAGAAVAVVPRRNTTRLLAVALLMPCATVTTYAGWAVHFGTGPYLEVHWNGPVSRAGV